MDIHALRAAIGLKAKPLLDFLGGENQPQTVVPVYQRTYAWEEKECLQLWKDILAIGREDGESARHFTGFIVYVTVGPGTDSSRLIIDGQQRLATVTLMLAALVEMLDNSEGSTNLPISADEIRNKYLIQGTEVGEEHFRLILSKSDKEILKAIVKSDELTHDKSTQPVKNYELLKKQLGLIMKSNQDSLKTVWEGLNRLVIVEIALKQGEFNPQLIYDSMNSTGRELSHFDRIRNFALMNLKPEIQSNFYERSWHPIEERILRHGGTKGHLDEFMRRYLTMKTGDIQVNAGRVYEAFKNYVGADGQGRSNERKKKRIVNDMRAFVNHYCAVAFPNVENDADIELALHDLRGLKVVVSHPFLMKLHYEYSSRRLSKGDFIKAIRLVESYLVRREIVESTVTRSHRDVFARFAVEDNLSLDSIKVLFRRLSHKEHFPTDETFKAEVQENNLYRPQARGNPFCRYVLSRIESHLRTFSREDVPFDFNKDRKITIEHIMPQGNNLHADWKEALEAVHGRDWKEMHEKYRHTLGNLTLTGYNEEYRDSPFAVKCETEDGFCESSLRLNKGVRNQYRGVAEYLDEGWNGNTIKARAEDLANLALKIWPYPD